MTDELGTISFRLAKKGVDFSTALIGHADGTGKYHKRTFQVADASVLFVYFESNSTKSNPPWLDFINNQLGDEERLNFSTTSVRANGLLLIQIGKKLLAASFGASGTSLLNKANFLPDFGIKTAMNMCGNQAVRQTKSKVHSITTKNIDRQVSRPSDTFTFGLTESEMLAYISAHIEGEENITLQGKDTLAIKVLGKEKLSWDKLIEYSKKFLKKYKEQKYKELFPNYISFQGIPEKKQEELDSQLLENLKKEDFTLVHLAIPEFIQDDEYSFSYTNFKKRDNLTHSYIQIDQLKDPSIFDLKNLTLDDLKKTYIYPYSIAEEKILAHKCWSAYDCLVAEYEDKEGYYLLTDGSWKKIDDSFYGEVLSFVKTQVVEKSLPKEFHNFDIFCTTTGHNKESIFNETYCKTSKSAIKFDRAKLGIGQSKKNKEFCDILELRDKVAEIIHVKPLLSSSINYLFSQCRFYCEYFLCDKVFLEDIRSHITDSKHPLTKKFLEYIKPDLALVEGKDYEVCLWMLYDKSKPKPTKADLPLMAKYELKLTAERLRNIQKYKAVSISFVPVQLTKFKAAKASC
jgi:uncharacterized protein (TIGR04141 family)